MRKGWQDLESRFRMMGAVGSGVFCLYSKHTLEVGNILSRHPTDTLRYNPSQCELLAQCMHVSQYFPSKQNSASRVCPYPRSLYGWMRVREGNFYFCLLAHVRETTGQILVGHFPHWSPYPTFNSINMSNAKLPSKCLTIWGTGTPVPIIITILSSKSLPPYAGNNSSTTTQHVRQ
jgi:hypothetical protein